MQAAMLSRVGLVAGSLAALAMLPGAAQAQDKVITQWDLQTSSGAVKIIDDSIARFEKANPGYKVEHAHVQNDAYKTKLKIAFGANQPPCVFASWGGGPLREYVKARQVVDLSNYLAKVPEYRDRFAPAGFKSVTFDGKIYGVPAENTAMAVIFYNKLSSDSDRIISGYEAFADEFSTILSRQLDA